MNKWSRVPSICLRSLTGWRARLWALGWIQGEVPQPGLAPEVRQKGWMVHLKGVIGHVTCLSRLQQVEGKPWFFTSLWLPSLSTRVLCPQHSPLTLQMGNLCSFHFYTNISKMCKKMLALTVSVCHLKEFAPANMDACMHMYLKFIFYFADECQTQSLSKC